MHLLALVQAIVNGLQMGLIYALVAVGLTLIWGLMEMINFAHGELMMWGMFAAWSLSMLFRLDPLVTLIPIGCAFYFIGVVVYRVLMSRVQRGDIFTQIFATFGLLLVIFGVVRSGRTATVPFAVGAYITGAYWFTSSTSFANPAVTVARMFSNTFAGIAPASVAAFVAAQLVGAAVALGTIRLLWPDIAAVAGVAVVPHDSNEVA